MKNKTMMQLFEWDLPANSKHWKNIQEQANELANNGINMVWLPPAYKGSGGKYDVGYGAYDLYDLGEFDQKGTIPTKYGTKEEYLEAIQTLHQEGIEVLGDIVLNHKMSGDEMEYIQAKCVYGDNRTYIKEDTHEIAAWTKFTFPNRHNQYSSFKWDASCFDGVDYDAKNNQSGIFLIEGKQWENDVDSENVNYDYLMGCDLDLSEPKVVQELENWGKWYLDITHLDGFRLDAIKHISASFYKNWLEKMRSYKKQDLFTVGEYWSNDLGRLQYYLQETQGTMSLFDVPLHTRFYEISHANASFDMSKLFDGTLTQADSWHSVTFVDNHDTQIGQSLATFVEPWFKPIAYGIILLQEKGIPCVFYGDYYGMNHENYQVEPTKHLKTLIKLRQTHAYGIEHDYYDHQDIVGFTREGDHSNNGLALLCSDGKGGSKYMYVGKQHANTIYVDALHNRKDQVLINNDGWGEFFCNDGNISVYIPQRQVSPLTIVLLFLFALFKKLFIKK